MPWLRFLTPWRSQDEIARYVAGEVDAGRTKPERAQMLERALRNEADGKSVVMRKPVEPPVKWPRSPEQARK